MASSIQQTLDGRSLDAPKSRKSYMYMREFKLEVVKFLLHADREHFLLHYELKESLLRMEYRFLDGHKLHSHAGRSIL